MYSANGVAVGLSVGSRSDKAATRDILEQWTARLTFLRHCDAQIYVVATSMVVVSKVDGLMMRSRSSAVSCPTANQR